jgi:hypothetical protein
MTDVKQSGLVTPGHLAEWATTGVAADSGTSVTEILEEATSPRTQRSVTTTPIVVEDTDEILNCNIPLAATCLLPLASSRNGSALTFQDLGQAGAHNIVVTASGGDLIDGLASVTLNVNYQDVTLVPFADGVNVGWTIDPFSNGGSSGGITVGAPVVGGTPGLFFYDNSGVVGVASAGGGGATAGAFATIASLVLASIPTPPAFAVVTDSVRGGNFVWSSANLSTQVMNDPGQGIYVAPFADTTGASGAWVRQFAGPVDWAWWNAIPDGVVIDPFGLGYDALTAQSWAATGGGQITYTTQNAHSVVVGASFQITGSSPSGYNGYFVAIAGTTGSTLVVTHAANPGSSSTLGTLCGPVITSGTDNGVALCNWNIWARNQGTVSVLPSAGTYCFNGGTGITFQGTPFFACYALIGITNMTLNGAGAVSLQNLYSEVASGGNSAFATPFPLMKFQVIKGYPIQQTVPGSQTFTFVNSGDAANFSIGQTMLLGSIDAQFNGYPPNMGQFEYVTILGISGGLVRIVEQIKYEHRTDFPDFSLSGASFACGAARAWSMVNSASANSDFNAWDGKFVITGMQVNRPPGQSVSNPYATLNKRDIVTENWVGVGLSESNGKSFYHTNDTYWTAGEIDKLVDQAVYNNPHGPDVGLGSQSANPTRMVVTGGIIGSMVGFGRQSTVRGTRITAVQPGAQFSMSSNAVFEECDIYQTAEGSLGFVTDGAVVNTIDGTNAYWAAAGTFVGTISGSTLTLTSVSTGSCLDIVGCNITASNTTLVPEWTIVTSLLTGLLGQAGSTYSLSTTGGTASGTTITIGNTGVLKLNYAGLAFTSTSWGLMPGTWLNVQASTPSGNLFSNDLGTGLLLANFLDNANSQTLTISASGSSYVSATGVITLTVSGSIIAGPGEPVSIYNITGTGTNLAMLDGTWIAQAGTTGTTVVLAGPSGQGTITITGGSTLSGYVGTMRTTLPFSAQPSWATNKIYTIKNNSVRFMECTGCDVVRECSDADNADQRYFEYRRIPFGGINGTSMSFNVFPGGQLMKVVVNVVNPSAISTARLTLNFPSYQTPSMTVDTGGIGLTINLGIAGIRTIDQNVWTGDQTSDALTVGGSAASLLPAGRNLGGTLSMQFFTNNQSDGQSASGEVIVFASYGSTRKNITRAYDASGVLTPAHQPIPTQGILP